MLVSTATAVLPVWRSPMISSRWPRPIGTIESIVFRPVCTGWATFLRQITPGATFSMTSDSLALTGPLPSIGWPSELTTRPISSGPTGTSRMRPVHLTVSPSVMCSYSPRITAPTESRSRFSARPKVSPGNSSISPCIAFDSPWMRQMPSVTDTTVPWVRTSAPMSRFWIRDLMISLISEGFSCMMCSLSLGAKLHRHGAELRLHRSVDHRVADRHARPADQLGVDGHGRLDLPAEALLQRGREFGNLRIGQFECGFDRRLGRRFGGVLQRVELRRDLRKHRDAVGLDQHAHEIPHVRVEAVARDRQQQRFLGAGVEPGVVERRRHPLVTHNRGAEAQHLRPRRKRRILVRELERRFGVGARNRR